MKSNVHVIHMQFLNHTKGKAFRQFKVISENKFHRNWSSGFASAGEARYSRQMDRRTDNGHSKLVLFI